MHVIGTAGHIDHGKSTLVRALTGIDPDRLQEEKARGMTIDLGFAWLSLPSGRQAGIVDVPGHQRFVKNMLAGVTGIDLVLFVVAATESWMPQTQEHLDIVNLLGIRRGIIVLTKVDLVDDEWLEMVREEVSERLTGTCLEGAPVVEVAAPQGRGIDELVHLIDDMLATAPQAPDYGRPRLWIDRAFSIRGAGTVVTGTLAGGSFRVDDDVEIWPGGLKARVRALQTHGRQVERAVPGSRVAVNLSGVERTRVERGHVLAAPGLLRPSSLLRVHVRLLPNSPRTLPNVSEVKFHVGTAERMARLRLLDVRELSPGGSALADAALTEPVAVEYGDPFVIREPGLHTTLGGGRVLDPCARPWRRRRGSRAPGIDGLPRVLAASVPYGDLEVLRARVEARAEDLPSLLLRERWVMGRAGLYREIPLSRDAVDAIVEMLIEQGEAVALPSYVWHREGWQRWRQVVADELRTFHDRYPLRVGQDLETLRSRLGAEARLFDESLQRWMQEGQVRVVGARVALADHEVKYTAEQEAEIARLWQLFDRWGYQPPEADELTSVHGFDGELLNSLVERGELVPIGKGLIYRRDVLETIKSLVIAEIAARGDVDVAALRDRLSTSRKYAVPLLEYFDQVGVTRRIGDKRVLARADR